MPFVSGPAWASKMEVTAAKLNQMVENLRSHDHRSDDTQGARANDAVVGGTTSGAIANVAVAASGWSITEATYRLRGFGGLVGYRIVATRTGAAISSNANGFVANTPIASLVAAIRPPYDQNQDGQQANGAPMSLTVFTTGALTIVGMMPSQTIAQNAVITTTGLLVL